MVLRASAGQALEGQIDTPWPRRAAGAGSQLNCTSGEAGSSVEGALSRVPSAAAPQSCCPAEHCVGGTLTLAPPCPLVSGVPTPRGAAGWARPAGRGQPCPSALPQGSVLCDVLPAIPAAWALTASQALVGLVGAFSLRGRGCHSPALWSPPPLLRPL